MADITERLNLICNKISLCYKDLLIADGHYATGALSRFEYEFTLDDTSFKLYFMLEDYWWYVENGREKGKKAPPIEAIARWLEIKNVPKKIFNGKIPTTKQQAYIIARSIGKNGIVGTKPLEKTLASSEVEGQISLIISALSDKFFDELDEYINKIFNTK